MKWNAGVLRTGSGQKDPAHGSEQLCSTAAVDQSMGLWRIVLGKMDARDFSIVNWPESILFGRPERAISKRNMGSASRRDVSNVFLCVANSASHRAGFQRVLIDK